MSSLKSINTKVEVSHNFWRLSNSNILEIVFQSMVFHKSKRGILKSYELALTQNYLIKVIPNSINKIALLDKKTIKPFTEIIDEIELFGFSISDREVSHEFYLENEEKFNKWLAAFLLLSKNFMTKINESIDAQKNILVSENAQASNEETEDRIWPQIAQCSYSRLHPRVFALTRTIEDCLFSISILTGFSDDFTLLNEIGHGSVGKVYLAKKNSTGKQFAVKAINKEDLEKNEMGWENLINEIKVMKKLNHPNIVKIYDVYECPNHICLILDYVEHGTLYSRIMEKKSFNEKTVAAFATKLLSVLDYLSSLNIIHRDIKLENILMNSENNDFDFKLADFGLATELDGNPLTRCGSPGYIAPEILRKLSYDFKADVFSSGVIFYILLSGKMPFSGRNAVEILRKNREGIISFKNENWKHVSKKGLQFIMKSMEPNSRLRPFAKELLDNPWLQKEISKDNYFDEKLSCENSYESINKKIKHEA